MIPNPSDYRRGTAAWNAEAERAGEAAADAQWQRAIDAYRNQDAAGFWRVLGSQLYNNPFAAPVEQAGTVANNSIKAIGTAAQNAVKTAVGNWGVWLLVGAVLIGAFLYLGGAGWLRKKLA